MKKLLFLIIAAVLFSFTACRQTAEEIPEETTEMKLHVQIEDMTFTVTLNDNAAVNQLIEKLKEDPLTVEMSDYGNMEKVGALGFSLPADDTQMTTEPGDIVLYNGSNIVMFYGSNTWDYTRLGKIDDLTHWQEALGDGDITATFYLSSATSASHSLEK